VEITEKTAGARVETGRNRFLAEREAKRRCQFGTHRVKVIARLGQDAKCCIGCIGCIGRFCGVFAPEAARNKRLSRGKPGNGAGV
jgi:hypothetical protein